MKRFLAMFFGMAGILTVILAVLTGLVKLFGYVFTTFGPWGIVALAIIGLSAIMATLFALDKDCAECVDGKCVFKKEGE